MSWWNPDTWWRAVDNTYNRVAGDIKVFVKDAIRSATDAIEADIRDVSNLAGAALNGLWGALTNVGNLASSAWNQAQNIVNTDLPNWAGDIRNWAAGEINSVSGWVSNIQGWINQAGSWVSGLISGAIATLTTDVINPITAWIDSAADFVAKMIDDAWQAVYRDVIHPIEADALKAWHVIDHLWQWYDKEARDAVSGVIKAWDWIVWFGEHTFTDLAKLQGDISNTLTYGHVKEWFKVDLEGLHAKVDDEIARIFGKG